MRRLLTGCLLIAGCWDIDGLQSLYQHTDGGLPLHDDAAAPLDGAIADGATAGKDAAPIPGDLAGCGGHCDLACPPGFVLGPAGCASRWVEERSDDYFLDIHALGPDLYGVGGLSVGFQYLAQHRAADGTWTDVPINLGTTYFDHVVPVAANDLYYTDHDQFTVYHSTGDGQFTQSIKVPNDIPFSFLVANGNTAYLGSTYDGSVWGVLRTGTNGTFSVNFNPGCGSLESGFAGNGVLMFSVYDYNCTSEIQLDSYLAVETTAVASMVPLDYPSDVLWATSATDLYAGSKHGVAHYQGTTWSALSLPMIGGDTSDVHALTGTGPNDIWGVTDQGMVFHYDGSTWSGELPLGTTTSGGSIAVTAPGDVWVLLGERLYHRQ